MSGLIDGLSGILGGLLALGLMLPFAIFGLLAFLLVAWPVIGFLAAAYFSGGNEGRRQKLRQTKIAHV